MYALFYSLILAAISANANVKYCQELLEKTEGYFYSYYGKVWVLNEQGGFKKIADMPAPVDKKNLIEFNQFDLNSNPIILENCKRTKKTNNKYCRKTKIYLDEDKRVSKVESETNLLSEEERKLEDKSKVLYELNYKNNYCYISKYFNSVGQGIVEFHLDLCHDLETLEQKGVFTKNKAMPPTIKLNQCKDRASQREAEGLLNKYKVVYPPFREDFKELCSQGKEDKTPLGKAVEAYSFCYTIWDGFNKKVLSNNKIWQDSPTQLTVAPQKLLPKTSK